MQRSGSVMKKFTSIAIACLLGLSVIPALAADHPGSPNEPVMSPAVDTATVPFQALSKLSATERKDLTPLTDTELAAVEGAWAITIIGCYGGCYNSAPVWQSNFVGAYSSGVTQSNSAPIGQNNGIQVQI